MPTAPPTHAVRENAAEIERRTPEDPAQGQRLQPRGAARTWNGTEQRSAPATGARPSVAPSDLWFHSWSAARGRSPSSPRRSWRWSRGPSIAGCSCRSSTRSRAALDALAACLELLAVGRRVDGPDADRPRSPATRSLKDTMAAVQGRPEALLMVEFSSDDPADVSYRVTNCNAGSARQSRHDRSRARARPGHPRPALGPAPARAAAAVRHARRRASRSRSSRTARSRRSGCRSSSPASARSSTATAPTARSTATPASAACTFARC